MTCISSRYHNHTGHSILCRQVRNIHCPRYIRLNCLRYKIIHQLYMLIRSRMKNKLRTCFFKYSLHTRTVSNICNQYTDLQILPMIRQFQLYIIQWGFCLIYQNQLIRIQCSQLANDFPSYSSRRSRNHYSTPLDMGRNFTHVNLHRFSTEPIFYLNVLYQSIVHTIA